MRAIGFRAESKLVHYAIVDGTSDAPVLQAHDKIKLQGSVSDGEALNILRTTVLNVLQTFKPTIGCVRHPDRPGGPAGPLLFLPRARIEGVVTEAVGAFGIPVLCGPAATIKSGMKTKKSLKEYSKSDEVRGIDLSDIGSEERHEAIYAAIAALGK